ncbi:uncharacterized protein LOC144708570 [Wolffia australiana]
MSSKQQVTITLGRSGQVVKRSGGVAESFQSDQGTSSGVKRSLRDRYDDNSDEYGDPIPRKRLRREDNRLSSSSGLRNGGQFQSSNQIGQDDLRFKLMQKKGQRMREVDLRESLHRTSQVPYKFGMGSNGSSSRIPAARSSDDLQGMISMRRSEPLDRFRGRSPDRFLGPSRAIPHPRPVKTMMVDNMPVAGPRPASFPSMAQSFPDRPLPTGAMKAPFLPVEPGTVTTFLKSLGLDKYSVIFQAEEIDLETLKQMGENDLKELGIPMGPRKKILLALLPRPTHQRRP